MRTVPIRPRSAAASLTLALALAAGSVTAGPLGDHEMRSERFDSHIERLAERLDLSADQERQIRAILEEGHADADRRRAEVRQRIDAVLTEDQKAEHRRMREERLNRHLERFSDRLDLSDEQQRQVRAVLSERRDNPDLTGSEIRDRIEAVLTEEQRERFARMAERRGRGGRGGRGGHGRGGPDGFPGPGPDF